MAKVTSKLQVTIPKAIADLYKIEPGDELDWIPAGDGIRVVPAAGSSEADVIRRRLELFDEATARQRRREAGAKKPATGKDRGWNREDLYRRDRPR